MGLSVINRLKKRRDFQAVYEQGIRRYSRNLILIALLIDSELQNKSYPTKIGISIGRKVSKKAVIRNLIKRQIRAVMRQLLPDMSFGWHIIIIVRPSAIECKYEHFLRELNQLLIKTGIINGH